MSVKIRALNISDIRQEEKISSLLRQLTDRKINFDVASYVYDDNNVNLFCYIVQCREDACDAGNDNGWQTVGFGALSILSTPVMGRVDLIADIVIDKNYRRRGYGKMLIQELIKLAKTLKLDSIQHTSNPRRRGARKLNQSLGFEKVNTGVFRLVL